MKGYPTEVKTVGQHLKKRGIDLNLKQREVASRLRVHFDSSAIGCNPGTVGRWEHRRSGKNKNLANATERLWWVLGELAIETIVKTSIGSRVFICE
jgi:hypothetical protein